MTERQKREQERKDRVKLYRMVQQIRDQDQLDIVLLDMRDRRKRAVMFEIIRPMIKRFEPVYSDRVREYDPDFVPYAQGLTTQQILDECNVEMIVKGPIPPASEA